MSEFFFSKWHHHSQKNSFVLKTFVRTKTYAHLYLHPFPSTIFFLYTYLLCPINLLLWYIYTVSSFSFFFRLRPHCKPSPFSSPYSLIPESLPLSLFSLLHANLSLYLYYLLPIPPFISTPCFLLTSPYIYAPYSLQTFSIFPYFLLYLSLLNLSLLLSLPNPTLPIPIKSSYSSSILIL